jgi:hypothetical protein
MKSSITFQVAVAQKRREKKPPSTKCIRQMILAETIRGHIWFIPASWLSEFCLPGDIATLAIILNHPIKVAVAMDLMPTSIARSIPDKRS